jgi:hypothetical protein
MNDGIIHSQLQAEMEVLSGCLIPENKHQEGSLALHGKQKTPAGEVQVKQTRFFSWFAMFYGQT